MATDHSTETIPKLLKANHPETYTLWVLCVDLFMCICVYGAFYGALLERNKMLPCHSSNPYMSELVYPWITIKGGYA